MKIYVKRVVLYCHAGVPRTTPSSIQLCKHAFRCW